MLDLHGLTQEEAHRQLDGFLAHAAHAGRRCVLVITGKGVWREESGILKEMVPRWLNEAPNRGRVLAIATAQPRHGGSGALYVLLKRRRES
jgi:DNA-nicking Smr family endonuclease